MLFKTRFHPGIVDGSITSTYRAWSTARVREGGRYRVGTIGEIEVSAVESMALGRVTNLAARRAGFADRDELVAYLKQGASRRIDARSRVWRVRFRYLGRKQDPRLVRGRNVSQAVIDDAMQRLSRMDARSTRGPWIRRVMTLIEAHPHVAASKLAPRLGRETPAFKADVRKLKGLGLTVSHDVGYSLSPLGQAVLARIIGSRASAAGVRRGRRRPGARTSAPSRG